MQDRVIYFDRARLKLCASLINLVVIIVLLVIPVYLTNGVVKVSAKDEKRPPDGHGEVPYVVVLLVFTFIFDGNVIITYQSEET